MSTDSMVKTTGVVLSLLIVTLIVASTPGMAASSDIVEVEAGYFYAMAVYDDGTVWGWGDNANGGAGDNANGVLGVSDSRYVYAPVRLPIDDVKAVSAGFGYVLALKKDGTVWAWGDDRDERIFLGNSAREAKSFPYRVAIDNVTAISSGYIHTIALRDDGTVWGWGANWAYQLGALSDYTQVNPVRVDEISDVVAIAAGDFSSYAIRSDGSTWAWGDDSAGELGNGVTGMPPVMDPVKVVGIKGVTQISAGSSYCLALRDDGSLWAWGRGSEGQLGIGQADGMRPPTGPGTSIWSTSVPVQVLLGPRAELSEAVAIFDTITALVEPACPDAPEIETINSSLANEQWTLDTINPAAYLAYGDDGRLYVFDDNNVSLIADGVIVWSISVPEKWNVCNAWYRPVSVGLTGSTGSISRPEPVYATGNGYLYLYVTPGKDFSFDVNSYEETGHSWNSTDKNLEWAVVAIAPDGKIAWTLPLTTGAYYYDDQGDRGPDLCLPRL